MVRRSKLAVVWLLGLLFCCGVRTPPSLPEALVTFDNGSVTLDDLNQYLGSLPISDRKPALDLEPSDWLDVHLTDLFLRKVLVNRDDLLYVQTDHAFQQQLNQAIEKRLTKAYLIRNQPKPSFNEADLAQVLHDTYGLEPRTGVFSIFLGIPNDANQAKRTAIRQHLDGIRKAIIHGTPFEVMAKAHSQSETARLGGWTGFMDELDLSSDLQSVLSRLEASMPSQVLERDDGFHLFMTRIMSARVSGSQRRAMDRVLRDQFHLEWLKQEATLLASKRGITLPAWPLADTQQGIIFQSGARGLTMRDLIPNPRQPQEEERQYYQKISEILFAQEFVDRYPEKAARLSKKTREAFQYRFLLRKALRSSLDHLPHDVLNTFLEEERNHFVQGEQVALTVFSWSAAPSEWETVLQKARSFIRTLPSMAPSTLEGATLERFPLMDIRRLAQNQPHLHQNLPQSRHQGALSKPFYAGNRLRVIRIDQLVAGELPPLDSIRKLVLARYFQVRESDLRTQWIDATKKSRSYRTNPKAISRLLSQLEPKGSF